MEYSLDGFEVIHASPPCQAYSIASAFRCKYEKRNYPDLIKQVRARLVLSGAIWIIENVTGAPMGHFVRLCGTQFGLNVYRHRQFESNLLLFSPGPCQHKQALLPGYFTVAGHMRGTEQEWQNAMGIDWMNKDELTQAIPPAYTEWLGMQVKQVVYG